LVDNKQHYLPKRQDKELTRTLDLQVLTDKRERNTGQWRKESKLPQKMLRETTTPDFNFGERNE
jgi:hypothetical protein